MAKKSKIAREYKIIKNVQKYASLRKELKDIIKSPKSEFEDKKVKIMDEFINKNKSRFNNENLKLSSKLKK